MDDSYKIQLLRTWTYYMEAVAALDEINREYLECQWNVSVARLKGHRIYHMVNHPCTDMHHKRQLRESSRIIANEIDAAKLNLESIHNFREQLKTTKQHYEKILDDDPRIYRSPAGIIFFD